MKIVSRNIVLVLLVGIASAEFNPLQQGIGNSSLSGVFGDLSLGNVSLKGVFDDLGEAGSSIIDGFDDVLKDAGITAADLTSDMIEHIKNVTQQLAEVMQDAQNTFKVKLNQNVIKPFGKGLERMMNQSRTVSDEKYDYDYVNYVHEGQVTPVKDQGQCGSCYAFAGVAAVESLYKRNKLGTKIFSEQQIIDCSIGLYAAGQLNNGCSSGSSDAAAQYFNDYQVEESEDYPYQAEVGRCAVEPAPSKLKINVTTVLVDNEDHLAQILNKNGPLVVYIYAGMTFNYYSGGVYNDVLTSKQPVDHAVLVVGIEKNWLGQEYWTIKNSWGSKWGEQGFIRFAKGSNIANMITNPITVVHLGSIRY